MIFDYFFYCLCLYQLDFYFIFLMSFLTLPFFSRILYTHFDICPIYLRLKLTY